VPAVSWNWYLGNSYTMEPIAPLSNATNRSLTLALDSQESASFSLDVRDPASALVQKHATCLLAVRNGKQVWSGPVLTKKSVLGEGQDQMQVGCVGWFYRPNNWLLKCGTLAPPNNPTTTATSQAYQEVDQCAVVADLISRGIYDSNSKGAPSFITLGQVPINTQLRNITYQEYQNIGQAITTLSQLEAGFDFAIDPVARTFDMYYDPIWPIGGPYTVQGRGQVRPNLLWGYQIGPANLATLTVSDDGSQVENEDFAVGQYGTGYGYDSDSWATYGLMSAQSSLSNVTVTQILAAYAQAEVDVKANGIVIYSFDQMPYGGTSKAYAPFDDFDIGDFGYIMANYGSVIVPPLGSAGPQPVRVFAFTVGIDDNGIEQCTAFQTTYQSTN
jgi:hypothetical protein